MAGLQDGRKAGWQDGRMAGRMKLLTDRIRPPVRVLFVGINPGLRSAAINHHFAGYSNRFWKLLYESGLVPEAIGTEDDDRLPEWGYGITNLVPRATAGIDALARQEYIAGEATLRRKVRRWKPDIVAFVGVTVYRAVFGVRAAERVRCGFQTNARPAAGVPASIMFEGARVFVLPNPSGRNANFSYAEMLTAFRALARAASRSGSGSASRRSTGPALTSAFRRGVRSDPARTT
jgi:TDG/mug DNA glycosylase family protein